MTNDPTPPQSSGPILPAHIDDTVKAIAKLHLEHRRGGTPVQRAVDALTRFIARPRFAGVLTVVILVWISANLALPHVGLRPFDQPPFNGLQGLAEVVALFATVFILITQKREDELSELREQLTLELAMLAEQKTAKLIELFEELRRDMPDVRDRVDREAEVLAQPADPEAVLEALKETQQEAVGTQSILDPVDDQSKEALPRTAGQGVARA